MMIHAMQMKGTNDHPKNMLKDTIHYVNQIEQSPVNFNIYYIRLFYYIITIELIIIT